MGTVALQKLKAFANPAPAGFVLTQQELDGILPAAHDGLLEDEGFAETILQLAGSDEVASKILAALEAELDRRAKLLVGRTYPTRDDAAEAVYAERQAIKTAVSTQGWTYLATLGVTR